MKSVSKFATSSSTSSTPASKFKILLVDDEPEMLSLLSQVLLSEGYSVLTSANGEEAMKQAQEHGPAGIDLLISDLVMPHMGGLQLASWFQTHFPEAKILLISGYSDGMVFLEDERSSITSFLPKPIRAEVLKAKVAELLEQ